MNDQNFYLYITQSIIALRLTSKMGKMKLIYFNARGRAELARLILAQAGEDYIDERIERDDWAKLKPSKSFHVLMKKLKLYL